MSAPAHVIDPRSPEWYAERRTYIGASDAAPIVGISPWRSEYELWLEKTGRKDPDPTNEAQSWGHRVEAVAADIYSEVTGRRLRRYNGVQRHKRWPYIAANPDRGVIGERRGVQIKSAWKAWETPPDQYVLQVQHEMGVMGWDVCDLAVLTGYGGFKVYEVPRNDVDIANLFAAITAWWQRHIVEDIEPPRTGRYLNALRGEDVMRASSVQADKVAELRAVRDGIRRLEERDEALQEWLKQSMVGAERLDGKDYGFAITWKTAKARETTDWKAVAAELSEENADLLARVAAHHTTTTEGSRPFRVTFKDTEEETK